MWLLLGRMSTGNTLKEPQLLCNLISHDEVYLSFTVLNVSCYIWEQPWAKKLCLPKVLQWNTDLSESLAAPAVTCTSLLSHCTTICCYFSKYHSVFQKGLYGSEWSYFNEQFQKVHHPIKAGHSVSSVKLSRFKQNVGNALNKKGDRFWDSKVVNDIKPSAMNLWWHFRPVLRKKMSLLAISFLPSSLV